MTTHIHLNQQILDTLYVAEDALPLGKGFGVTALIHAIENGTPTTRLSDRMVAVLRKAEAVLDQTADADGDSFGYRPNRAMHALVEVRALLAKLENGVVA